MAVKTRHATSKKWPKIIGMITIWNLYRSEVTRSYLTSWKSTAFKTMILRASTTTLRSSGSKSSTNAKLMTGDFKFCLRPRIGLRSRKGRRSSSTPAWIFSSKSSESSKTKTTRKLILLRRTLKRSRMKLTTKTKINHGLKRWKACFLERRISLQLKGLPMSLTKSRNKTRKTCWKKTKGATQATWATIRSR